jgi:RNA recognition motif-containing protein
VWCIGRRPCYGLAAFLIPAIPERQGLNMDITLYIDNLNVSTTEEELKTLFMQAGEVTSITINKDQRRIQRLWLPGDERTKRSRSGSQHI